MAKARGRYTATSVAAAQVVLTQKAAGENDNKGGDGGIFGTGTITIATAVTPSGAFWRTTAVGGEYLVEITKL